MTTMQKIAEIESEVRCSLLPHLMPFPAWVLDVCNARGAYVCGF